MELLARRAARLALLLVGVTLASFVLLELSPVDPVDAYLGGEIARVGPEQRGQIAERLGVDEPPLVRLGLWAGRIVRGDLGTSTVFRAPVAEVIGARFAASLALLASAWVLSGVLGFALGLWAAVRLGRPADRAVRWFAYTLASAPTFWVGLLLLSLFSVQLGWTPVSGATPLGIDPAQASLWQRLHHLLLPAATLSIVGVAPIALHTRQQAVEILEGDAIAFARAQGERGWGLIRRRLARNAAVPALLLQFASLSELFGGSVLAEQVFGYPGLGQATVTAALRSDVPLLLGIVLFSAIFVFVGNTIGDVVHGLMDPRVGLLGRREPGAAPGGRTGRTAGPQQPGAGNASGAGARA